VEALSWYSPGSGYNNFSLLQDSLNFPSTGGREFIPHPDLSGWGPRVPCQIKGFGRVEVGGGRSSAALQTRQRQIKDSSNLEVCTTLSISLDLRSPLSKAQI